MFVILLHYVRPLAEVDQQMKAHMAYLRAAYRHKVFIVSGRRVPRTGGVILARAPSREALEELVQQDPFVSSGVATFEIIEFRASQSDPDFKVFVD